MQRQSGVVFYTFSDGICGHGHTFLSNNGEFGIEKAATSFSDTVGVRDRAIVGFSARRCLLEVTRSPRFYIIRSIRAAKRIHARGRHGDCSW